MEDDTSHAVAALRESTARLELATTLADLGTWSVELRTGAATQDMRLRAMLAVSDGDQRPVTELWMERIHPAELRATRHRLLEFMRHPEPGRIFRAEHRIVRPDGSIRWLTVAGQLLTDERGVPERMVGVAQDITRWRQLRDELQRWADVFQYTTHAVILSDARADRVLDVNPALAQMLGYARRELRGQPIARLYHPSSLHQLEPAVHTANTSGRVLVETTYARRDGAPVPVEVDATLVSNGDGEPLYRIANVRDLREERRLRDRQLVLVQAGELLASSLDYEATIWRVVELAVPSFADWASFSVPDAHDDLLRTVSIHHANDALRARARAMSERYPRRLSDPVGAGMVFRSGVAELIPDVPDELLGELAHDEEHLEFLRELGCRSVINVPVVAHDRPLGILSFGAGQARGRYDAGDLGFARELAHRAALAMDNAQRYAAERASRERTEWVQRVSAALSGARTPAQVAAAILRESMPRMRAFAGAIWLADGEATELQLLIQQGFPGGVDGTLDPLRLPSGSPAARILAGSESHLLLGVDEWVTAHPGPPAAAMRRATLTTVGCFPLLRDDSVRGLVVLGFREARRLTDGELEFMRAATTQGAQAMDRALLLETAELARQEAEAANAAKSDFLAVMSHELRTPLNAIAGYTQLLELGVRGPVTPEQLEDLRRIQRSQHHLLVLINDVLNFARLEAGRVEYELEPLPVSELLAHASEIIAPQAGTRGLSFHAASGQELVVHADREKVHQILLNLLANATRFTPAGGQIAVESYDGDGRVLLEVRDTGPGIPADQHERIFEPFVQLGRSRTRPGEGTGLGLSISRDLARGMGGDLRVRSREGEGSRFILELPRAGIGETGSMTRGLPA